MPYAIEYYCAVTNSYQHFSQEFDGFEVVTLLRQNDFPIVLTLVVPCKHLLWVTANELRSHLYAYAIFKTEQVHSPQVHFLRMTFERTLLTA